LWQKFFNHKDTKKKRKKKLCVLCAFVVQVYLGEVLSVKFDELVKNPGTKMEFS